MGAATADSLYAALAGLGLTFITKALIQEQIWLKFGGAFFLFYLGVAIFFRVPSGKASALKPAPLIGDYLTTFFLTITNPLTILSFAAVFAALGTQGNRMNYAAAGVWILGVFFGSALWWYILSFLANRLRGKITPPYLRWINRISGSIIFAFGLFALLK